MEVKHQYSLEDFNNIIFNGFCFDLPDVTLKLISDLSSEVGSPTYVKTPVFQKREMVALKTEPSSKLPSGSGSLPYNKKRRGKNMEIVNDEEWETIRTFHTTKIEQKTGTEAKIDSIRSYLNKLTDKNLDETMKKIFDIINDIEEESNNCEENIIHVIMEQIFENAFNNRFYSRIYSNVYARMIEKYDISEEEKDKRVADILEKIRVSMDNFVFMDSSVDYDLFCKMNKENERRKAMCEFLMNIITIGVVSYSIGLTLLRNMLNELYGLIGKTNKKNEVDELVEIVSILWKKEVYLKYVELDDVSDIIGKIGLLAHSKAKDYLSLTNKSIFKFMDMIDM